MTEEFIGMESVSHVDYRDELGYSLEELFDEYQKANKKLDSLMFNDKEYDPTVARMKKILYQLSEKIRRDHLFTNNEEISEVDTGMRIGLCLLVILQCRGFEVLVSWFSYGSDYAKGMHFEVFKDLMFV